MTDNPDFIQAQKYLDGVDYPVDRDTLVEHASRHGADTTACSATGASARAACPSRSSTSPTHAASAMEGEISGGGHDIGELHELKGAGAPTAGSSFLPVPVPVLVAGNCLRSAC